MALSHPTRYSHLLLVEHHMTIMIINAHTNSYEAADCTLTLLW